MNSKIWARVWRRWGSWLHRCARERCLKQREQLVPGSQGGACLGCYKVVSVAELKKPGDGRQWGQSVWGELSTLALELWSPHSIIYWGWWELRSWWPHLQNSNSSNKFPHDVDTTALGTTLWEPITRKIVTLFTHILIKAVYCHPAYLTEFYAEVHHAKCQAGWSTSWNQDCREKYQ